MSGWIVGVDAGGTSSRALARHLPSGETRTAETGGANWTVHGPVVCQDRLAELVRSALPSSDQPEALALCLAGFYPPEHASEAAEWASRTWPSSRIRIEPDFNAAWAGAFGGKPGIIVISGTGSIAYGRNAAGEEARAGGWGPLFGDEGSAYSLGRKALIRLAREHDEGAAPSPLTQLLLERHPELGNDRRAWLRGVYRHQWGREEIAALATDLSDAAADYPYALGLLQVAGIELANLARTVYRRLGFTVVPLVLLGGVGDRSAVVRKSFAASTPPEMELITPEAGPLEGALRLAQEDTVSGIR